MENPISEENLNKTQSVQIAIHDQDLLRQQQLSQISSAQIPNHYLCWSIFNTLCCNVCLGIVAIIYSVETRKSIKNHNLAGAQRESSAAFKFNLASFLSGALVTILLILFNSFVH